MSKLWLVARKELGMMTRTTAYRIATAAGPLAIVVLLALPVMLERLIDSTAEGRTVAFVAAGPLLPAIRAELTAHGITVEEAAEESLLAPRVLAGDLDGYVVIPADVLGAEEPRYVIGDTVLMPQSRLISGVIGRAVVQRRLELEGLDADRVTTLTRLPQMQVLMLDEEGMVEPDLKGSFWLMLAFVTMLLTMLIVYGQAVGHAVLTEKTGKTAEIMLSSLPPFALLAGKVLGKGLAGVLQFLAWTVISLVVVAALGSRLGVATSPLVQPGNLLVLVGFFVLGFLLYSAYSAGYAIAGAIATDEENFSQLLWPVSVMQLGQFGLALALLDGPDGPPAVILSLIPMTAPMVMYMRVVVGEPGAVQVAVAVAGVVLLTLAAVWAAAKVFRLGILLTGKKGTFREIVRLLRA